MHVRYFAAVRSAAGTEEEHFDLAEERLPADIRAQGGMFCMSGPDMREAGTGDVLVGSGIFRSGNQAQRAGAGRNDGPHQRRRDPAAAPACRTQLVSP